MNAALKDQITNKLLARDFECYCKDSALVIHIPALSVTIRIKERTTISVADGKTIDVDTPALLYKIARGFCRWAWVLGGPSERKVFRKVVPILIAVIKRL